MSVRIALLTARDPLSAGDGTYPIEVATALASAGHDVTLVLLEDAVVVARDGHRDREALAAASAAGAQVWVDQEAAARRAVRCGRDVKPADFGAVVDLLLVGSDRQAWL